MIRSVHRAGRGGGSWNPTLSPGLIGWWNAQGTMSLDGSNRVQQLDNSAPSAPANSFLEDHAVLGSTVSPTYQATGWNSNRPCFSDSPPKRLNNTTAPAIYQFAAASVQRTIAFTCNVSGTANMKFVVQWTDFVDDYYALYFDATTENLIVDVNNGSPVDTGVSFTGAHTVVVTRDGGDHIIWKDGEQVATLSQLVNAGGATDFFAFGTDANGNSGYDGKWPELCLWTNEHNDIGAKYHEYARARWGGLP